MHEDEELFTSITTVVNAVASDLGNQDLILQEIVEVGKTDPDYQGLLSAIREGFPSVVSGVLSPFKKLEATLSSENGIALHGSRIIVPRALRKEMLKRLHASHQGIERTQQRARQTVFWPGVTVDIKHMIEGCDECQLRRPSLQREPIETEEHPTRIFEQVAADYFEVNGNHHLVLVDKFSGWPQIYHQARHPTASSLIRDLVHHFSNVGCPNQISTDGGLQFTAQETRDFFRRWGVTHRISSPHYAQSNGLAEAAVKTVKHLLIKTGGKPSEEFAEGLLELRNTPRVGGRSPAEIIFGHPLRTRIPAHKNLFARLWKEKFMEYDMKRAGVQSEVESRYNDRARPLHTIEVGTKVRIQDHSSKLWNRIGVVVHRGKHRDYKVRLPSGSVIRRNRRFLRPIHDRRELVGEVEEVVKPVSEDGDEPKIRRSKRVRFLPDRFHA